MFLSTVFTTAISAAREITPFFSAKPTAAKKSGFAPITPLETSLGLMFHPETNDFQMLQDAIEKTGKLYVFGYGSLMWNPHMQPNDIIDATLSGYQRDFCVPDKRFRGADSENQTGLTLGLCPVMNGDAQVAQVSGKILAYDAADAVESLRSFYEREKPSSSGGYVFKAVKATLNNGTVVTALTCVADINHPGVAQASTMNIQQKAYAIAYCWGENGTNRDYLQRTCNILHEKGFPDDNLDHLLLAVDGARFGMAQQQPLAVGLLGLDEGRTPSKIGVALPSPARRRSVAVGQKLAA
ncbi:MAG: gamma-glutamylcyclotransferase [Alphaproteobacteria bacterium]